MSESQGVRRSKYLGDLAGEHPAAIEPLELVRGRIGEEVPTTSDPVDEHAAKNIILVTNIEDVRPTVVEQDTRFAVWLERGQVENLRERGFRLAVSTQESDDDRVLGALDELAVADPRWSNIRLGLAEKPVAEVRAETRNLHSDFWRGVLNELFRGDEVRHTRESHLAEILEKRHHDLPISTKDGKNLGDHVSRREGLDVGVVPAVPLPRVLQFRRLHNVEAERVI